MNHSSSLLFLSLLVLSLLSCKKENTDITGEFSVLCYNVAGLPEAVSSSSPETYTTTISPLLNKYDLVHVQEDFCYHDSLILYNTHPYLTDPMPCVPDGDGLNTFSNFPIRNFARYAWDHCYGFDCFTPKGFSYSEIIIEGDYQIDVYNLHCNAGSNDQDFEARNGNIAQLIAHLQNHSEGDAVILMGDFNSRYTRDQDTIRALLDMGFKDLWVDLIRAGDVPPFGDKLKECEPLETAYDCETVDKIFYKSNDQIELTPTVYQRGDNLDFYFMEDLTQPLSDHAPLTATFSYRIKTE